MFNTHWFFLQLDLITNLLGTPKLSDMRSCAGGAVKHMLKQTHKPAAMSTLYTLSQDASHEAVHLLCQMLVFDPVSFCLGSVRTGRVVGGLSPFLGVTGVVGGVVAKFGGLNGSPGLGIGFTLLDYSQVLKS